MKWIRKFADVASLGLGCLLAVVGCDRGSRPEQLGKAAPMFVVSDAQRTVDLSKLRGRVIVLNFWASWCAPCVEELPSLEALQHSLPQVAVVGVSMDEDSEAYRRFLTRHHVEMLTVQDAAQQSNGMYGTFRPPETYVIDKSGTIRRKYIGAQDFMSPEVLGSVKRLVAE